MTTRRVVLTYKEYEALPADGRRYEIHEGELSVTPAPGPQHQMTSRNLFGALDSHVRAKRIGEVLYARIDVILADTSIIQPDIVYLDPARLDAISRRGIEGPPTLVIEIVSPSTTLIDRSTKHQLYARCAVPFFWLVDPEGRAIEALRSGRRAMHSPLAPLGRSPSAFHHFPILPWSPPASGHRVRLWTLGPSSARTQ